jgi:hypothetical protein
MRSPRSFPRVVLPIASAFVVLAVLWWAWAVPTLVKYPTDLDVTSQYAGTFTLFVDPATAQPLGSPASLPLTIERHIKSLSGPSGSSRAVVEETITQKAGDLLNATQTNVYVMDRRTMKNVADDRAYAFEPSNIVDRSGSYRLNLPFGTDPGGTYEVYKNETNTTYALHGNGTVPATHEAGLELRSFAASTTDVPLDAAYLKELGKLVQLPTSITFDQLKGQLRAVGLDVDAVLAALQPVMTRADLTAVAEVAAKPIPLQYVSSFKGETRVELSTGAQVAVGATESVGVRPVFADAAALHALLSKYPNVAQAAAAAKALEALSSAPATKLFEFQYQQTPASVADVGHEVVSMRNQIRMVETYVPLGLLAAAAIALAVGAAVYLRRKGGPRVSPPSPPPADAAPPARSTVSTGRTP